jgi:GT2 family glycosyltransferase
MGAVRELYMDVSIIIVNYYSAAFLARCLESVAAQTYAPRNVLIINNGDTPGALDFVDNTHPEYRVIEQANRGFAASNNFAIDLLPDCEWVALLNPDAFPEPDWLENLLRCAQECPCADVFSSQMLQESAPQLLDGCGDSYHISGLAWRGQHGKRPVPTIQYREVFSACCAAALFRRAALLQVGGFDESFFCYFEDVDLGFRLRLHGFRCIHVPAAVVKHVGSASSGGPQSDFALYHGHRNLVWTFVKNMPGLLFWLLLPIHVALNVMELCWFSMQGRSRIIWQAKRDAIKRLPSVWRQRREVQRLRKIPSVTILKSMSFWPLAGSR